MSSLCSNRKLKVKSQKSKVIIENIFDELATLESRVESQKSKIKSDN
ncbi:hypothetical protein DI53_0533 [Sphingobacterium deserti]|uniref:Uncharacterized protein n=1 Tax=Sphingobacterium deserti TaxID=1229276 RepID=A0A0B8TBW8_9SPHI|nr:hypothetical protein DI53_0533 [Sphingobacterium deserti]